MRGSSFNLSETLWGTGRGDAKDSKEQRASFVVSLSYSTPTTTPTPTPTVSGCVVYSGNRLKTIIVPTLRSLCRCQLQKMNAKMAKRARRQWTNEMSWDGDGLGWAGYLSVRCVSSQCQCQCECADKSAGRQIGRRQAGRQALNLWIGLDSSWTLLPATDRFIMSPETCQSPGKQETIYQGTQPKNSDSTQINQFVVSMSGHHKNIFIICTSHSHWALKLAILCAAL